MGFPREDVADVEVAVSEAVTNSVEHGAGSGGAPEVVVKCRALGDLLVVEIEDEGLAESLPPCAEASAAQERGRGVLMMRALMDECENCRTENGIMVRMTKQKAGAGQRSSL